MELISEHSQTIEPKDKTWAVLAHASVFTVFFMPFGNIIGPMVIWLAKKDSDVFAAQEARKALNFQIMVSILFFLSVILCFILIGIPLVLILVFISIIYTILGTLKASNGEKFNYPFDYEFVK